MHTDENGVTLEGFIRKDRTVKVREKHCKDICATLHTPRTWTLPRRMFKFVKRWEECMDANGDYMKKKQNICKKCFLILFKIFGNK